MSYGFKIMVEGDYALFSRPEMKVERVSYDVPTPGALEGLLKSVYWKNAIRYVIDEIVVFNPIKFVNIRRNEVSSKISYSSIKKQMKGVDTAEIYTSEYRTQRASMLLRDVKYGISFHFELTGIKSENEVDGDNKHYGIISRRLKNGQYFRPPCLGCSEFPVKKLELVEEFDYSQISPTLMGDIDLGYVLYGMKFSDGGIALNNDWNDPKFSDKAESMFYRPRMINGIIDVKRYRGEMKC